MAKSLAKITGCILAAGLAAGCGTYNPDNPFLQITLMPFNDAGVTAQREFKERDLGGALRLPNAVANGLMRIPEAVVNSATGKKPRQPGEYNSLADSWVVTGAGWGALGGYVAGEAVWGTVAGTVAGFGKEIYDSLTQKKKE